ncbi:hypothetical protein L2E82_02455 [Cichorium intybus]|uniref:Uncharacterized protein n=1 Tax=Cichorium intybus TaxID=13427 RepID=A0ACB9H1B3_CICIN|nr:hypothetical protein L2E82_02455 [Cichorium intybus]
MDAPLKVLKNNLHLWNLKVLKLKQQQEITKNYLETNIKNLQITNETLQKLENFMAESHSNPNFMSKIMDQLRKEQEHSNSSTYVGGLVLPNLPFVVPILKILSRKVEFSFVYKLFDMVNDPNTNSVLIWSKLGTSFFIKDVEGLHDHIRERFNHNIKTFYKTLGEFLKKKLQREMEEEVKRLGFFQNELKLDISNMKKKEQIAKWDLWLIKRCLENASRMIAHYMKVMDRYKMTFLPKSF